MNLEAFDMLSLALGVLEGDPHTHRILADLYEELGDRGKAQWARSKKSGSSKRLDFVLAMMPPTLAMSLACDMFHHVLAKPDPYPEITSLLTLLEAISGWAHEHQTLQSLEHNHDKLGKIDLKPYIQTALAQSFWDKVDRHSAISALDTLVVLVRWVTVLEHGRESGAKARHIAGEVGQGTKKIALFARQADAYTQQRGFFNNRRVDAHQSQNELQWQIQHTRESIVYYLEQHHE